MIKVEDIDVWGFKHAIRGMRNPMNSWEKSDSSFSVPIIFESGEIVEVTVAKPIIGQNDLDLMKRLFKAGTEHRKYLRQIFVSMDITAPLYWWKEWDTYKFVVPDPAMIDSDSCSTMHKITAKEFELNDFSHEHLFHDGKLSLIDTINALNRWRRIYLNGDVFAPHNSNAVEKVEPKDKRVWWQLIQLLPSSYNQKRTITMSYETLMSVRRERTGHKLDEWRELVKILDDLPYVKELATE